LRVKAYIVGSILTLASAWIGYSIGEHRTTVDGIAMKKQAVLAEVGIQIKAVELIDAGELDRLRALLLITANSNMDHIELLNGLEKEANVYKSLHPKSSTYFQVIENTQGNNIEKEEFLRTKLSSYSEFIGQ